MTAKVVADDAEALAVGAAELAAEFATGAAERDATRRLPRAELDRLSASGLLAITVPAEHGGADVSTAHREGLPAARRRRPNIAQIPHSRFVYVNVLRHQGTPRSAKFFFGEVLAGKRIGNAQSEIGTKHLMDYRTRLTPTEGGGYLVNGTKYYATGALFAHWIAVLARGDDDQLTSPTPPPTTPASPSSTTGAAWASAPPPAAPCTCSTSSGASGSCRTTSPSTARSSTARSRRWCTRRSTSGSLRAR